MSKKRVMKLASRGKRLGAYCIDAAIPFAVMIILMTATGAFASRNRQFGYDPFGGYGYGYGYGDGFGYGYGNNIPQISGRMAGIMTFAMLIFLIYLIVQLVFFSKSKTMGKAALGLQVISSKNGKPIGFWMMLLREWIVKSASSHVFLLGYIWVMIDEKNRGWHDKILDTYVIDLKESEMLGRHETGPAEKPEPEIIESAKNEHEAALPVMKEPELPIIVEGSKSEEFVELENDETAANVAESIESAIGTVKDEADKNVSETITEAASEPTEEAVDKTDEKDL